MLESGRPLEAREALEEVLRAAAQFRRRGGGARAGPLPLGRRPRRAGRLEGLPGPPPRERPGRSLPGDARPHRLVKRCWVAARPGVPRAAAGAADGERRGDEAYGRGQYAEALARVPVGRGRHRGAAGLRQGGRRGVARRRAARGGRRLPAPGRRRSDAGRGGGRRTGGGRAGGRAGRAARGAQAGGGRASGDRARAGARPPTPLLLAQQEGADTSRAGGAAARRHRGRAGPGHRRLAPRPARPAARGDLRLRPGACSSTARCCAGRATRPLVSGARHGAAECALSLGRRSATSGREDDAALWFAEAARIDSSSPAGRAALLA